MTAVSVQLPDDVANRLNQLSALTGRSNSFYITEAILEHLDDPRSIGDALKGSRLGNLWKYRVGDYRIIADIEDGALKILVVKIGNRRAVYR